MRNKGKKDTSMARPGRLFKTIYAAATISFLLCGTAGAQAAAHVWQYSRAREVARQFDEVDIRGSRMPRSEDTAGNEYRGGSEERIIQILRTWYYEDECRIQNIRP